MGAPIWTPTIWTGPCWAGGMTAPPRVSGSPSRIESGARELGRIHCVPGVSRQAAGGRGSPAS